MSSSSSDAFLTALVEASQPASQEPASQEPDAEANDEAAPLEAEQESSSGLLRGSPVASKKKGVYEGIPPPPEGGRRPAARDGLSGAICGLGSLILLSLAALLTLPLWMRTLPLWMQPHDYELAAPAAPPLELGPAKPLALLFAPAPPAPPTKPDAPPPPPAPPPPLLLRPSPSEAYDEAVRHHLPQTQTPAPSQEAY